ncbi:MAG: DNA polymerase III subunit delta [Gemmatimonadetes bacterium]|nr:DNA polymerase III subunit delta [Gemmatimonadota bacterium]
MSPEALQEWLDRGGRGGVFFLFGEDEFRKEEAARALVGAHLDPATRDFNLDVLHGSELDAERFASVLATPPMLAEWRVVVVREAEALATQARSRERVLGLLDRVPPGLALILLASVPAGSRARFYEELQMRGRAARFTEIDTTDLPGWLMQWTRARLGVDLEEGAARALAAAVGSDLAVLTLELEKLASYAGGRGRIREDDVRAAGIVLPRVNRWAWFDLVGERRFREALPGLRVLLAGGETGVGLTIGLGTQLLRVGVALEGGIQGLERVLPPRQRWLAPRIAGQARRWTPESLAAAVRGLRRVDQLLKSSSLSAEHLLEEWLLSQLVREVEVV